MSDVFHYTRRNTLGVSDLFETINPNITINTSGELDLSAGSGSRLITRTPLGNLSSYGISVTFRKGTAPTSSSIFMQPFNSSGSNSFRTRFSSTNTILIDNGAASFTQLGATPALTNGAIYRFEACGDVGTGAIKARIFELAGGTQVGSELSLTGQTINALDNMRFMQVSGSPNIPQYQIIEIRVTNTFAYPAAPPAWTPVTAPTVVFIGDSTLHMDSDQNVATPPDGPALIGAALTARGWDLGNMSMYAIGGKHINAADQSGAGKTGAQAYTDMKNKVAGSGHPDYAVVFLGTNCNEVDATVNAEIDALLAVIDSSTHIIWLNRTSKGTASSNDIRVNGLIAAKLATRGNAQVADWDSHIRAIDGGNTSDPNWIATDSTHHSYTGNTNKANFAVSFLPDLTALPYYIGGDLAARIYVGTEIIWEAA